MEVNNLDKFDGMSVDFTEDAPTIVQSEQVKVRVQESGIVSNKDTTTLINCLINKKVTVKFIPNESGFILDPKHVLYGGLGQTSKRRFVVPVQQNGVFKNVLTNNEKNYLEYIMGLPDNAMSVYKKIDNYWENRYVTLGKEATILDLSVPDDFIKYKILLANEDYIAPSEQSLRELRKATYQFVMVDEEDAINSSVDSITTSAKAYMIFGEYQTNLKKLAAITEFATGKKVSKLDKAFVYAQAQTAILEDANKFIKAAEDPYLDIRILIGDAVEKGHVTKRGHYYYLTETKAPLCNNKQEPTINVACQYLSAPKNQEILFTLQSKVTD